MTPAAQSTQVDLLYSDGCPNWKLADERVREALVLAGLCHVRVRRRSVVTWEDAEALQFRGSPTVLVNGRDPFAAGSPVSLSCRLYGTDAGLSGSPTVAQLLDALASR